jgi:predicted transcriptional regulator
MQQSVIFRCEPSLKQQAERIAKAHDETMSQVLRRALREYVQANAQRQLPRSKPMRGRLAQGKVR